MVRILLDIILYVELEMDWFCSSDNYFGFECVVLFLEDIKIGSIYLGYGNIQEVGMCYVQGEDMVESRMDRELLLFFMVVYEVDGFVVIQFNNVELF